MDNKDRDYKRDLEELKELLRKIDPDRKVFPKTIEFLETKKLPEEKKESE